MSAATASARLRLVHAFVRDIRSPEWGLAGQVVRFVLSGTIVALAYLGVTILLHDVLAVRFQIALASGYLTGVVVHFTLQRVFVWRYHQSYALAMRHQVFRYLCVSFTQYGLTVLFTSVLPGPLGVPVEAVYLATAFTLAGVNFVVFRIGVFHPGESYVEGEALSCDRDRGIGLAEAVRLS